MKNVLFYHLELKIGLDPTNFGLGSYVEALNCCSVSKKQVV
jgi:hypothetical protein